MRSSTLLRTLVLLALPCAAVAQVTITGISPSSVTSGVYSVTLTVTGTNFCAPGAPAGGTVFFTPPGGTATGFTSTPISTTMLTVAIPYYELGTPGIATVAVQCATQTSPPFNFTINPRPTLTSVSPDTVAAGGPGFTLTLTGTNFVAGDLVAWCFNCEGSILLTPSTITPTQMTVQIPANLYTTQGFAGVEVQTADGVSTFSELGVNIVAAPTITGVQPTSVLAGSGAFTLTVSGTGFNQGDNILWNGAPLAGTQLILVLRQFVLTATVPAGLVASPSVAAIAVQDPGGVVTSSVSFPVLGPGITSLSPNAAPAGSPATTLTINGTNFAGNATAQWNGTQLAIVTQTAVQILASVPANLLTTSGNVTVTVTNPGGVTASSTFIVLGPTITSLTPNSAIAGSPGFNLVIAGANFVPPGTFAPTPGSTVTWSGNGIIVTLTLQQVTAGQITAAVPTQLLITPGTYTVTVTNPGGASTNSTFTVSAPTVTGLSPSSATAGSPALNVTITGTNFLNTSTVTWGSGNAATPLQVVSTAATQIVATIPANLLVSSGTFPVTVSNSIAASSSSTFAVVGPGVTSLNPPSAIAGSPALNVTITGTNFLNTATVTWGSGNAATPLQVVSSTATQIVAAIPAALLVTPGAFAVTVADSNSSSSSATFNVVGPTVTSLNPPSAIAGSPALNVTITGTNFLNTATVTWGSGNATTPLQVVSTTATQIVATIPAALLVTPGSFAVTVADSSAASAAATFTIGSPGVTGLSPSSAIAGSPALNVTITGTNFLNTSTVTWGGGNAATPLQVVSATGTQIVATIPAALLVTAGAFAVTVADSNSATATSTFNVVGPSVTALTPSSASAGGPAFNLTITGTNFISTSTVTWGTALTPLQVTSVTANQIVAAVPANLLLTAGTFQVTVSNSRTATASAQFTVGGPTITSLSPSTVAAGNQGFTLTVTGSNFVSGSSVKWSTLTLPQILSVSATVITVAVPAGLLQTPNAAPISVVNPGGAVSNTVTFTVGAATLVITTTSLPSVSIGSPYSFTLTGTGGVPPYVWSASGLPQGFSLDPYSGIITGNSTSAASANITVQLTDSKGTMTSKGFAFSVSPPGLSIDTPLLTNATVGVAYSQTVTASGGSTPYTWTVNQGSLPDGLSLKTVQSTAVISGTPTTAGTTSIGLLVTDSSGATSGRLFTLTINPPSLTITTSTLPDVTVGVAYTAPALQATGGKPPYTWALGATTTTGFSINSSTGVVTFSGTPTPGPATLAVQVTDSAGSSSTKTFTVNITSTLTITTPQVGPGSVGVSYPAIQFASVGGIPPISWSVQSGSLPGGLTLSTGGNLSGTPNAPGGFTFSVQAADSKGQTASKQYQITVTSPVVITTTSVPDGIVGSVYSASLAATGGVPPYTWSASGLPEGVTLDPAGTLGGTPTRAAAFNITLTVTDSAGRTVSKPFTSNILPALTISTSTLPDGVIGSAYSVTVQATGGLPPYTYAAGGLPDGLSIDPNSGQISGTPTAAGTITVSVTVTDAGGHTTTRPLTFKLAVPPFSGITIGGLPTNSTPQQQPNITITTNAPYPVDISGTLTLTFTSAVGGDDLMIQFSTGGRTVNFTIPAGSTTAKFSTPAGVAVQTGTVAGTITLVTTITAGGQDITPAPTPQVTIVIPKSAPVITSVKVTRNSTGFSVDITGYSPTRDMTQAVFTFTAAAGASLQNASVTVTLNTQFTTWFQNTTASDPFGGQFTVTIPFTTQGDPATVTGFSVTLANSFGVSAATTTTF